MWGEANVSLEWGKCTCGKTAAATSMASNKETLERV